MATIQELAREAEGWFETARREESNEDRTFVRLRDAKDGPPEWVRDLVYDAHGGMLPDDWRYQTIRSAVDWIAECDDPEDAAHEFADGNVDVYTGGRLAWLASDLRRPGYCDQYATELGDFTISEDQPDRGIVDLVGLGQYAESLEVFESVKQSLEDQRDELEAAELFGDNDGAEEA